MQGGKHNTKLLEILLQFRSKVRSTCITELKALKKARKARTKAASMPSSIVATTTAASSSTVSDGPAGQVASLALSQCVSVSASDTQSVEQALTGLLKACDDVRDADLASLGVRVEDVSEQASSWGVR